MEQIKPVSNKITHVFNNAGFGWYGYFKNMDNQKITEMINVNITAVTLITRFFAEIHKNRNSAPFLHIFNIGSIAGFFPIQGIVLYSATKSFIESFTKSLHSEYSKDRSIYFTLVLPGAIKTDFFNVAQESQGAQKIKINMFELGVDKAVNILIRSIFYKKKILFIPSYMKIFPLFSLIFGRMARNLGPILLEKDK